MTVEPRDAAAAQYIDAKADACRRRASYEDAETHLHTARVLDALADEIRMGLHA